MFKYLVLILSLLFPLVSQAKVVFSPEQCQEAAQVAGYLQYKVNAGEEKPLDVLLLSNPGLNLEIIAHLRLLEKIAEANKGVSPEGHSSSYLSACFSVNGDIETINEYIKRELKITDI